MKMTKKLVNQIENINIEISHYEFMKNEAIKVGEYDSAKLFEGIAIGLGKAKSILMGLE